MAHMESFSALLSELPDNSNVAVVTMLGSCCPVTLAHVQAFIESRRLLLGEIARPQKLEQFAEVIGLLALNGDGHVKRKLEEHGEPFIPKKDRGHLVKIATADLPWLNYVEKYGNIESVFPELNIVHFDLNGADDVVKYHKWKWASRTARHITVGRPGSTQQLLKGMSEAGLDADNEFFIIGPELADVSSTAVRNALRDRAGYELKDMLHPGVIEWCLAHGPYQPQG